LNDRATQLMKSNKVIATSLDTLLLDNPEQPAEKMSIEPFQKAALALCDQSNDKK
ncbi:YebY family protein, partial [Xenorhabdus bovienii]|nr:YebY family protein [Xenorhabdus bovienii]